MLLELGASLRRIQRKFEKLFCTLCSNVISEVVLHEERVLRKLVVAIDDVSEVHISLLAPGRVASVQASVGLEGFACGQACLSAFSLVQTVDKRE